MVAVKLISSNLLLCYLNERRMLMLQILEFQLSLLVTYKILYTR